MSDLAHGIQGIRMISTPVEVPTEGYPVYTMRLRVRQYEMDAFGHVNNAVYLNYLEQAGTEHAEALGFPQSRMSALGGLFVVRRHEIDYLGAAVAGDELAVTTWPEMLTGVRAIRAYEIRHLGTDRRLISARTLWVWVDIKTGRPRPIPRELLEAFAILTDRDLAQLEP
jgi:acyl-CoA thioester hydrolase